MKRLLTTMIMALCLGLFSYASAEDGVMPISLTDNSKSIVESTCYKSCGDNCKCGCKKMRKRCECFKNNCKCLKKCKKDYNCDCKGDESKCDCDKYCSCKCKKSDCKCSDDCTCKTKKFRLFRKSTCKCDK